jgi:hypothetical protein
MSKVIVFKLWESRVWAACKGPHPVVLAATSLRVLFSVASRDCSTKLKLTVREWTRLTCLRRAEADSLRYVSCSPKWWTAKIRNSLQNIDSQIDRVDFLGSEIGNKIGSNYKTELQGLLDEIKITLKSETDSLNNWLNNLDLLTIQTDRTSRGLFDYILIKNNKKIDKN